MALYQNGILISGANTLPQMTLAEYQALPVSERPTYWERTDLNYNNIPASDVTYGSGSVEDALDALTNHSYGTYIDLGDTSSASPYTAPSDGVVLIDYPYNTTGYIYINVNGIQFHSSKMHTGSAYTWTLPVRKGTVIYKDQLSVTNPAILFVPYV